MRHAWLPIVLAALFGLRLPLCVTACLEAAPATPVAAAEAPCHGGEQPANAPEPATHECECDETQLVVATLGAKEVSSPLESPLASFASATRPIAEGAAAALHGPHRSPPPRDLLLLNATLLL